MNEMNIKDLENILSPLDDEARNSVMLAVNDTWRVPPMTRETVVGEYGSDNFLTRWPSIINEDSGYVDISKVDQMMSTGQIAYPMMLKKAPVISIVRSASGFSVKSADEEMAKIAHANLQEVLPKRIEEILTYLEYGAYYGEVTYEPVYPQDYGLDKSNLPSWVIEDFNGVHPNTVVKILRDDKTKSFRGFVQQPLGVYEPIEVGLERALIIPNNGQFGNLAGDSVLGPVYVWWFWYEMVWRAYLRFLQRAGVGVVIVKAPSRGRVEIQGKSIDNMQWALQMASSLHRTNYAAVPSDMDSDSGHPLWVVDYLKMGQNEGVEFTKALELLSDNIKNYLLTGNSGSATEGAEFEVMLDTEKILGHIGMYISEYVLPKMFYWNNSTTTRASLEFQGSNSRVMALLFKLMAVAGNTAGDALQNVDWRSLFSKGGVPVLTEEEVEELQKEKEEAFKKQQEAMFRTKQRGNEKDDEKAKMPPGGEGRWVSERDKKGEVEKLEMIRDALNTSIIVLGADQVARMEELGLRAQDNPITLANPYHDKLGRFAKKGHSHGGGGDLAKKTDRYVKRNFPANDRISVSGNFDGYISQNQLDSANGIISPHLNNWMFAESSVVMHVSSKEFESNICAGKTDSCSSALAIARGKTVHISPIGIAYTSGLEGRGEHIITHELYHTRTRSGGGTFNLDGLETKAGLISAMDVEEGTTDLLARKDLGYYDDLNKEYYKGQMGAIAIIAASLSGFDLDEAWKIVDSLHFNMDNWSYVSKIFAEYLGIPQSEITDADIYAMMQSLNEKASSNNYAALGWMFSGEYVGEREVQR